MASSVYMICFGAVKENNRDSFNYVRNQLSSQGLTVTEEEHNGDMYMAVCATTMDVLLAKAEELQVVKLLKNSTLSTEFTVRNKKMFQQRQNGKIFSPAEEMWLLYRVIQSTDFNKAALSVKKKGRGNSFLTYLKTCKPAIVTDDYPLHSHEEKKEVIKILKKSILPWKGLDLNGIASYFGEEVGFYFAWLCFYSRFILIPLVVGLLLYFMRPSDSSVDTDAYLPLYSVVMAIWGVLFLVFWQRQSSVHSFTWNTYNLSLLNEYNPEFHGTFRKDPVTDQQVLYYPEWKRRLWYVFSVVCMIPLLLIGVLIMMLSLNLNGYVRDTNSPIYVAQLTKYAQPGGIFAADSPYYGWLVPTIMHSVLISIINRVYSSVAEVCTYLENHRSITEWKNSLIVKRVFFECFDCFMPLFYIAFYQLDVVTLRAELVSLFMSDEIRRLVVESILPVLKEFLFAKGLKRGHQTKRSSFLSDIQLDEYDLFDDYLEMVVQFGYVTLFASAFTLGPLVTILFLYLELHSDLFKLLYAYRRPLPRRVKDIGVWYEVMNTMVFISVLTNCAILGFASEQLMQWLPWMFTRADGDQALALGSGRYVVGIVVGTEHLILLLAMFLRWIIPTVPEWVQVGIARREYLKTKSKQS